MTTQPQYRDETWLRERYAQQRMSMVEISEEASCASSTIERWINKHGIETRDANHAEHRELEDGEWLREEYTQKSKSTYQIAEDLGVDKKTVSYWLKKHNIQVRNPDAPPERLRDSTWLHQEFVEKGRRQTDIARHLGCAVRTVAKWIDRHGFERKNGGGKSNTPLSQKSFLREQYEDKEKTQEEIAEDVGCSRTAVSRWMRFHGIEARSISGENNPRYNGGHKLYGPGWTGKKKRAVRERDGFECQDPACNTTQEEHISRFGQKLHVHHLRKARDVDDSAERNAEENLITLCRDCHRRWEKIAETGLVPQVGGVVADD